MERPESLEAKKAHYMDMLWKKAEEFSVLRTKLQTEADSLFKKIMNKDVDATGLYATDLLRKLQDRYYELLEEIEEVKAQENELQSAIEGLDQGKVDETALTKLLGKEERPKLSRRKQKILEERIRTGVDPRTGEIVGDVRGDLIDSYVSKHLGPGSNKLTTGRHGKRVKGNLGSSMVDMKGIERHFFESTQDTHGGKAKHGKHGSSYVSKEGKKIRKR